MCYFFFEVELASWVMIVLNSWSLNNNTLHIIYIFVCKLLSPTLFNIFWNNHSFVLHKVILHSQVKATLTIYDAWMDLQDGFSHTGQGDGRPASAFFPLVISPTSKAGILFSICFGSMNAEGNFGFFSVWLVHKHLLGPFTPDFIS